jgi:hypothetical protein
METGAAFLVSSLVPEQAWIHLLRRDLFTMNLYSENERRT